MNQLAVPKTLTTDNQEPPLRSDRKQGAPSPRRQTPGRRPQVGAISSGQAGQRHRAESARWPLLLVAPRPAMVLPRPDRKADYPSNLPLEPRMFDSERPAAG